MNEPAWWVYILRCSDGSLYTGIARNLQTRLVAHNTGNGARYTRSRRPVELVYREPATSRASASKREWMLKRMRRATKLALIGAAEDLQ